MVRKLKILAVVFVSLVFITSLSVSSVNAQVVINEILANPEGSEDGEYIELFNSGESVDLEGYTLSDKVKEYEITGTVLDSGAYLTLYQTETSLKLNNSGDEEVSLKDSGGTTIDSMTYGVTTEGKSWSRIPNGTGSFVNGTELSPSSENIALPTNTPTPSPTSTPEPTNVPTATNTPTTTPVPTLKKKPPLSPKVLADKTQNEDKVVTLNNGDGSNTVDDIRGSVLLGGSGEEEEEKKDSKQFPIFAIVLVAIGGVFVGLSAYIFWKNQKKEGNLKDEKIQL